MKKATFKRLSLLGLSLIMLLPIVGCAQEHVQTVSLPAFERISDRDAIMDAAPAPTARSENMPDVTADMDDVGVSAVNNTDQQDVQIIIVKGQYAFYPDVDSLARRATDIIRVEVLDSRVELVNILLPPFDPDEDISVWYDIHTVYRLRVIEVFKGNMEPGMVTEVMQTGGLLDNIHLINYDFLEFIYGDDLVLFIYTFDDGYPDVLLNPHQSVYLTKFLHMTIASDIGETESIIELYRADLLLADDVIESFSHYNNITLTVGDLMRIYEESA